MISPITGIDPILAHHIRAVKTIEAVIRPERAQESICSHCGGIKVWDHAEKCWSCLSCGD
jgi:ribosomal protein L37AE/L43A